MSDAIPISREEWLQAYERYGNGSPQALAAKQVFDALEDCDSLIADFNKTLKQKRAQFTLKYKSGMELIRVVVHHDSNKAGNVYASRDRYNLWPTIWDMEFKKGIGISPAMGSAIVDWCVTEPGNTTRLICWLENKAHEAKEN